MKFVAEIACTKAQASIVEWALDAMEDYADTADAGYTKADLPKIVGSDRAKSIFLPSWRTLTDLLYRLEEQYPDMAGAERGKQASIAAAGRLADSIRTKAMADRGGKRILQQEAAARKRINKINTAKKPTSFAEWKAQASAYTKEHEYLGFDDILDEDDPYDLKDAMQAAFDKGDSPEDFIEEAFGEDIASHENDNQMAAEAEAERMAEFEED